MVCLLHSGRYRYLYFNNDGNSIAVVDVRSKSQLIQCRLMCYFEILSVFDIGQLNEQDDAILPNTLHLLGLVEPWTVKGRPPSNPYWPLASRMIGSDSQWTRSLTVRLGDKGFGHWTRGMAPSPNPCFDFGQNTTAGERGLFPLLRRL